MMNVMKKKLNKKGFTLAELLVVVAIIAILVAISIPIFTSRLNEARKATDQANVRAAKAAAVTEYLGDQGTAISKKFYDADSGKLVDVKPTTPYGQSSSDIPEDKITGVPKDNAISVAVAEDGTVTMAWE